MKQPKSMSKQDAGERGVVGEVRIALYLFAFIKDG